MKKLELVKLGVDVVVGIGVGIISGNALAMVTPVTGGVLTKICTKVGATVLESMMVSKATDYVDETIDDLQEKVQKIVGKSEETE